MEPALIFDLIIAAGVLLIIILLIAVYLALRKPKPQPAGPVARLRQHEASPALAIGVAACLLGLLVSAVFALGFIAMSRQK